MQAVWQSHSAGRRLLDLQQLRINDGMWMMPWKCSNCETIITDPLDQSLLVSGENRTHLGLNLARLCSTCTKGVLTMKLVFKRSSVKEDWKFEQYLPVESEKL